MKEIQELIKELQTVAERCDIDDNYDLNDAAEDVREIAGRLEKAVTPCNQLATRKAMEEIKAIIKVWNRALVSTKRTIDTIDEIATQVLETPPRNCDLYATEDEAWNAYLNVMEGTPEDKQVFFETWLFNKLKGV